MNKQEALTILAGALKDATKAYATPSAFAREAKVPRRTLSNVVAERVFPSTMTLDKLLPFVKLTDEVRNHIKIHAEEASKKARNQLIKRNKENRGKRVAKKKRVPKVRAVHAPALTGLPAVLANLAPHGSNLVCELARLIGEQLRIAGFGEPNKDDGVRFLLTQKSFRPLGATITQEEVEDTRHMVQELCRRWKLFAEIEDPAHRMTIVRMLGSDVNALFLVMRTAREQLPFAAAELLEKQARAMGIFQKNDNNRQEEKGE